MGEQSFPEKIDILIITALEEEFEIVIQYFEGKFITSHKTSRTYYFSKIHNAELNKDFTISIVCIEDMGNTEAAASTAIWIEELNPEVVLMFGLAGGIGSGENIGTILLPTSIYYYEHGKEIDEGYQLRPTSIPIDNKIKTFLLSAKRLFIQNVDSDVNFLSGPIAVGEKVIASQQAKDNLLQLNSKNNRY